VLWTIIDINNIIRTPTRFESSV